MTPKQNRSPSRTTRRNSRRPDAGLPGRFRKGLGLALVGGLAALFSSCGGGGSTGDQVGGGAFVLIRTEPSDNGRVFLNQTVRFTFSNPVDLSTVSFNSVVFNVRDEAGNPVPETVVGTFGIGENSDNEPDPRILTFKPRLPTNDTYTDGGFKPGRTYLINFAGGSAATAQTIRDTSGRPISVNSPIQSITLTAPSGSEANQLFLDGRVGGPRVTAVAVTPSIASRVSLNKLGDLPVEVRLTFNQPIDPASTNVPKNQNQDPLEAKRRQKGRIFLEYDDPEFGPNQWVRAQVAIERNDELGAVVVLRPDGVLPNNASIRVVVLAEFQDIGGETNVQDASYREQVGSFQTEEAFESQFDAIALDFGDESLFDISAPYRDPVADIMNGVVKASFDFEGLDSPFDYGPSTDVVLNTEFTVVRPLNGNDLPVSGGVFPFRNIDIPAGVRVSASGPNPLVFLATGDVKIEGTLAADGGDGEGAIAINSANVPTRGGAANGGGGKGGRASQVTNETTPKGENGFGPGDVPDAGGEGGETSCGPVQNAYVGAGGGGGSMATQGDPDFYNHSSNEVVQGNGGPGNGSQATTAGGSPGDSIFDDENPNNDFWGRQVTGDGTVFIGELAALRGGNGGAGGGDRTSANCLAGPAAFFNDERGGGGGAGGGVLVIKALGTIEVTATGLISANGGHGGGGEPNASSKEAGGGGGGSGGMVVLMSARKIEIWQHGNRWEAQRDSSFAVTADGGIGLSLPTRTSKYVASNPGEPNRGGFGGMGVVQLMAPPGTDADNTQNVQDDNVSILDKVGVPISGTAKTDWLYGGDIRPRPYVMPVPFSRFSQVRTRWISTGATVRTAPIPNQPRVRTILPPDEPGPDYFFSGLQSSGNAAGYVATDPATGQYAPPAIELENQSERVATSGIAQPGTFRGQPIYRLSLAAAALPTDGRYANYRAFLRDGADAVLSEFRIVGHEAGVLYLDQNDGSVPEGVTSVSVHAKFFDLYNNGTPGLGEAFPANGGLHPITSLQVGFAFHLDPSEPDPYTQGGKDYDRNRFPEEIGTFTRDLESAAARAALAQLQFPFAKVQLRFNLNYDPSDPDNQAGPNAVNPTKTKRPEIRKLILPYRF